MTGTKAAGQMPRPVKLQASTKGAWRDVVFFDAGNERVGNDVMDAAALLGNATAVHFRIAKARTFTDCEVLLQFTPGEGWARPEGAAA